MPSSTGLLLCLIVGISDGDTLTARCGDEPQMRVRLAEIDAPEKAQPFGQRAKQMLSSLTQGKTIRIQVVETDRYGRSVAQIYADDAHINAAMVESGMAWCYTQYLRGDWCVPTEAKARAEKQGLWGESNPVPPWEWRRSNRGSKDKAKNP